MKVRRGIQTGVCAVAAVVVCGAAPPRAFGEASKAESLIREGIELRGAGHDARALPLFQQAYELERTPRTAGQLGLCELSLGYWLDAEVHLGEGLASVSHPWIEKNRGVLTESLGKARENLGEVTLAGGPAGAAVVVDRREIGRLPLPRPLRLIRGPHDVEVRFAGHEPWRQAVAVLGADKQTLVVVIVVERTAVSPPAATIATPVTPPDAPSSGSVRRPLAWTGAALGAGMLAFGGYETYVWLGKRHDFDDHRDPVSGYPDCTNDAPMEGGAGCHDLHEALVRARTLALVSYGVTALLAAGSAYLFATSSPPSPKTDTALSCTPDPSTRGLSCFLTF
jgi:hypothetical protein